MNTRQAKKLLTRYALGDLDPLTRKEVKQHLDQSESCRAAMQDIEPTLDLLHDALAAPSKAPERLTEAHRQRILAAAAAKPHRQGLRASEWLFVQHPMLVRVAAVLVIAFILCSLFVPATARSRKAAQQAKAQHERQLALRRSEASDVVVSIGGGQLREAGEDLSGALVDGKVSYGDRLRTRRAAEDESAAAESPAPPAEPQPLSAAADLDRDAVGKGPVVMRGVYSGRSVGARASTLGGYVGAGGASGPAVKIEELKRTPDAGVLEREEGKLAEVREQSKPADHAVVLDHSYDAGLSAKLKEAAPARQVGSKGWSSDGNGRSMPDTRRERYERSDKSDVAQDRLELKTEDIASVNGTTVSGTEAVGLKKIVAPPQATAASESVARPAIAAKLETASKDTRESDAAIAPDKPVDQYFQLRMSDLRKEERLDEIKALDEPARVPRPKAWGVNPFVPAAQQPFSTFSIDVDTASYTLSRNELLNGRLPVAESVRTEEFVNFFDYGYRAPTRETFRIYLRGAPSAFGRGYSMLEIGIKGRRLGREEQRAAVLTFLVDTSGSMDKPDRMGLVKEALASIVGALAPRDRVAIVQFDSHARVVLDHTPASEKKTILDAVGALQCSGSTDLEEGMNKAYELAAADFVPGGENRVLVLSDGVANLGNMEAGQILANVEKYRKQGILCSVFGFGSGTYDDTMLETLANKGDGSYAFIDSSAEVKRVLVDDLGATLNTIAKDVKIQVEFNPKRVKQYRQLGYENRQLRKEDFRNDAVDAGEVGSGQSVTALYELELQGDAGEPMGTVRVRYRRTDTGAVEEIEEPIRAVDFAAQFAQSDVHFRLGACVAEFAEILRGSPYAQGSRCADVARVLGPVALDMNMDTRVQELLRLVRMADGMMAGE